MTLRLGKIRQNALVDVTGYSKSTSISWRYLMFRAVCRLRVGYSLAIICDADDDDSADPGVGVIRVWGIIAFARSKLSGLWRPLMYWPIIKEE